MVIQQKISLAITQLLRPLQVKNFMRRWMEKLRLENLH